MHSKCLVSTVFLYTIIKKQKQLHTYSKHEAEPSSTPVPKKFGIMERHTQSEWRGIVKFSHTQTDDATNTHVQEDKFTISVNSSIEIYIPFHWRQPAVDISGHKLFYEEVAYGFDTH